ncbi:hypothetical protein [Streptomyces sp. NPDC020965]|uniref:hypothetical protein n=1 Tax=Streptomyces sp. NPDC020965 TaxID=3365105 RepID=UPI00378CA389
MTFSIVARMHLMVTFVLVMCVALCSGICGAAGRRLWWLGEWLGWVRGIGPWLSRRPMTAFRQLASSPVALVVRQADGYGEGIAGGVSAAIVVYQAAVFPLTLNGVTGE